MLVGIVGKANVGKSTFFKALTLADVLIANYPFATIKPNKGFGHVKIECADKEFGVQCNPRFGYCHNGIRFVPVEVVDVAGLVPGAHEGKGMGNQFLDDLRQADVLIHVVDIAGTTNEKGEPVDPGSYDPEFDVKFLEFELDMWYLSIIKKGWEKSARQVHQEGGDINKVLGKQLSGLGVTEELVKQIINKLALPPNPTIWAEEQLFKLATALRKETKPLLIAANKIDVAGAMQNLERVKKNNPERIIIPCSAESELALKEAARKGLISYIPGDNTFKISGTLSDRQKQALEFIQKNVLDKLGSTGVQQTINIAVLDFLKFIAIFPGGVNKLADQHGNVLPDCFMMPPESTALDFAFKLHTDLGNKFIRAIDVKTKRVVGREHQLKHRDVVEIITSR